MLFWLKSVFYASSLLLTVGFGPCMRPMRDLRVDTLLMTSISPKNKEPSPWVFPNKGSRCKEESVGDENTERFLRSVYMAAEELNLEQFHTRLKSFAYQTNIGVDIFVFGGLVISIIAFATVSFKSFNAANGNPVNALRDE